MPLGDRSTAATRIRSGLADCSDLASRSRRRLLTSSGRRTDTRASPCQMRRQFVRRASMRSTAPPYRPSPDAARRAPSAAPTRSLVSRRPSETGSPGAQSEPGSRHERWLQSAQQDVLIKVDTSGQIVEYRLERPLRPADLMTLSEAAAFLGKSTQTLRNWARDNAAFPGKKMGGHWVVVRPYLDTFLLHAIV